MDLPKKIEGNDPYTEIADGIIKKWCEKYGYTDFLVTILLNGVEFTEFLSASDFQFIWENDWWEGEKDVQLLGFVPIASINIYGCTSPNVGFSIYAFESEGR